MCFYWSLFDKASTYYGFLFFSDFLKISPFFPLLYSMVTQLHTHVYILFSHIIMFHHKWLHIVPSATQQDLLANPFRRQSFISINPKLPNHPTPSPSSLATTSLYNFESMSWVRNWFSFHSDSWVGGSEILGKLCSHLLDIPL